MQFILQAILEFGAEFCNFHAGAHHELTAEQFARLVVVNQFAHHAAILAILIPAEPPIRDGFRADVLKAAENRVLFRDLEGLPEDLDFNQPFIGPKNLTRSV